MAVIIIPTRTKWQAFKKKYGVPDGAASGINLGKVLDAYEAAIGDGKKSPKVMAEATDKLEASLNAYIGKVDKKKIKDYAGFQKEFLKEYSGAAHAKAADFRRYQATDDVYKKEVMAFLNAVQHLKPNHTTAEELQKFRSGPLRGLSAVGSGLRTTKIDVKPIDVLAGAIQNNIDTMPHKTDDELEDIRKAVHADALKIGAEAKKQGVI